MSSADHSTFNKPQHIKYWLRCLKTHLPTQYTSNDSQRTTFGFFILSALDLLGVLHERTTASEREAYINWFYRCQHPDGGFRGFTGADVGDAKLDPPTHSCWDPANLAATFFSLAALTILGDDLKRVRKNECLRWVKRLQLEDGSFGEAIGEGNKIEGGRDVRYCYLAAAVRWIMQIVKKHNDENDGIEDIDVDALVGFITSSQVRRGNKYVENHVH